MSVQTTLRQVQGIANTVQGVDDVLGRLTGGSFWSQLRPASYRGIPFAVLGGQARFGRRNAVHEYPFRDTPWVEDLGKAANRFQVTGFLVGDDVIAQRDRMVAAAQKPGDGELIHPTFGRLNVALLDFSTSEHWEQGRVFEITFSFMEQGQRLYPETTADTGSAVGDAADTADASSLSSFVSKAASVLTQGVAVANAAAQQASAWAAQGIQVANDATSLIKLAVSLPGSFGRLLGLTSGVGQAVATVAGQTVQDLIGLAAVARAGVASAGSAMSSAGSSLSANTTSGYATSAQGVAAAVYAAAPTPGDAIRGLSTMAAYSPTTDASGSALNMRGYCADLFRRAAVVAAARASSDYTPTSSDDAVAIRTQVLGLIDNEITTAGDQGEDDVYAALRALRAAVVQDLNTRGASVPTLMTVQLNQPLPSLALAQKLYQDPGRADELVGRAAAVHPAFMPPTFQALNA